MREASKSRDIAWRKSRSVGHQHAHIAILVVSPTVGFEGSLPAGFNFSARAHMKAFVVEKYGKSGLRAAQVPDPIIGPRDVLVRVSAASINPLDKMVRNGGLKLLDTRRRSCSDTTSRAS